MQKLTFTLNFLVLVKMFQSPTGFFSKIVDGYWDASKFFIINKYEYEMKVSISMPIFHFFLRKWKKCVSKQKIKTLLTLILLLKLLCPSQLNPTPFIHPFTLSHVCKARHIDQSINSVCSFLWEQSQVCVGLSLSFCFC